MNTGLYCNKLFYDMLRSLTCHEHLIRQHILNEGIFTLWTAMWNVGRSCSRPLCPGQHQLGGSRLSWDCSRYGIETSMGGGTAGGDSVAPYVSTHAGPPVPQRIYSTRKKNSSHMIPQHKQWLNRQSLLSFLGKNQTNRQTNLCEDFSSFDNVEIALTLCYCR